MLIADEAGDSGSAKNQNAVPEVNERIKNKDLAKAIPELVKKNWLKNEGKRKRQIEKSRAPIHFLDFAVNVMGKIMRDVRMNHFKAFSICFLVIGPSLNILTCSIKETTVDGFVFGSPPPSKNVIFVLNLDLANCFLTSEME